MNDEGLIQSVRVKQGAPARLTERDPADKLELVDKDSGSKRLNELASALDELHTRLWAEAERSVLLVLQGMDSSGKDGTIRHVLSGLNPQGCTVAGFKAPTELEKAHDYLWRIHSVCPPRGHLGVFNRSHYEDVIAGRFVGAATREHCQLRYRHLREFERMLVEEGTTIVKVFLHISKDEQRKRLQRRLDDPLKNWKFNPADLSVRKKWDEYMRVYDEVISETSTDYAPWHVVPADRKWVRDVVVAMLLVDTFRRLDPRVPPPDPSLKGMVVE